MENKRKEFSRIYDQYIDKIYRFVYIKVNSQEIAEDLSSDTFLRCWEKFRENPNKIENPQAFLFQIARNLVTDYYREKGRTKIVSAEFVSIIDPNNNLEKASQISSDFDNIKEAITKLNGDYQDIIIWHYIDDLSVPEIAKITDRSEGAVRVSLHRAINALKNECNKLPHFSS